MCRDVDRIFNQNIDESQELEELHDVKAIQSQTNKMNRIFRRIQFQNRV